MSHLLNLAKQIVSVCTGRNSQNLKRFSIALTPSLATIPANTTIVLDAPAWGRTACREKHDFAWK